MKSDLTYQHGETNYTGVIVVPDPRLEGKKHAEMREGDNEVHVSPAMYELLDTDSEAVLKKLKVKILPALKRKKQMEGHASRLLP